MNKFRKGQTVYFVRSKTEVIEATVINAQNNNYTIKFKNKECAGIRVRESKLFDSEESANQAVKYRPVTKISSYKEYW